MQLSDHNIHHSVLFNEKGIKKILEFGLGGATEQFLTELDKVVSVEIYTKDKAIEDKYKISGPQWMPLFEEQFGSDKWEIIPIEVGPEILKAENDVTGHGKVSRGSDPTTTGYKKEIEKILDDLKIEQYDYVFVDAGIHLRGDIVNALFGRVKMIGAHDTNDREIYGYERIVVPEDYRETRRHAGCGFTLWEK